MLLQLPLKITLQRKQLYYLDQNTEAAVLGVVAELAEAELEMIGTYKAALHFVGHEVKGYYQPLLGTVQYQGTHRYPLD